ncbi:MAG: TIGR03862 family flavoprotein, partial [Alphaproteobacteria bacterium]|nr:TIGR03862 family flavoprotein [Alphaproteobacteria bacterium]
MAGRVAIIGAGPAGLMAAEVLAERGIGVDIYDAMPSAARKFLMAGKSGLNITHSEPLARFLSRYRCADPRLVDQVRTFGPDAIRAWMAGLGIKAVSGPSGRVFPEMMKASPLLRAWLKRLSNAGARLQTRHRWQGWGEDGALLFETPQGRVEARPVASIFALGGASWSRLGSTGAWADLFTAEGLNVQPFGPNNCGFLHDWSAHMLERFAGAPVKSVAVSTRHGGQTWRARGEFVITSRGVESGSIYALSAPLNGQLAETGAAHLVLDLLPDLPADEVARRLARPRAKQSLASFLRKT